MRHLAQGHPTSLTRRFVDDTETPLACTTVTVAVFDDLGVAIPGSPFAAAASGAGVWSAPLPSAATAGLGLRAESWTATLTAGGGTITVNGAHEVVGAYLFDAATFRAFDPDFASTTTWTPEMVRAGRDYAEELLERHCRASFRRRRHVARMDGTGTPDILVPEIPTVRVAAASVAGVALTSTELAELTVYEWGGVFRPDGKIWPAGDRNIMIAYEHGFDTVGEPVAEAAMILARDALVRSPAPDRAIVETSEHGLIRNAIPGRDGPTGFPRVDAIITQFAVRRITVG